MASRSANSSGRIRSGNGYTAARTSVTRLARLAFGALFQASYTSGAPIAAVAAIEKEAPGMKIGTVAVYVALGISLVLLGGVFAGLTIALMGQDEIYLQVIATSDDGPEQRHAQKVSRLLAKGKHWVLVTLLLANVIVNESLPIVLDRCMGGGWMAVVSSTAAIVVFGEVIPQSICVRHGLYIGARFSSFVTGLMWILAPVGWPIAKLLDRILGSQHGTVYKKTGLKTLITLHKTLGSATERLNQDEVTIISAVLDLKDKSVGDIMTPMGDVFTMSADTVLDEDTTDLILKAGYSRIPIHEPGNTDNFVGMLLVKILITYDPEDCKKVSEFALATLPETRPETSCLDIVNFFQEGKSHMVLVSDSPGENTGAIGVVTLEDVIEELIGEEIIDESDVYIDVHKAIRRMAPAPTSRLRKSHATDTNEAKELEQPLIDLREEEIINKSRVNGSSRSDSPAVFSTSPKTTFTRRSSSGAGNSVVQIRGNAHDMREHLKHLGPSNLASRPKTTRFQTVKIKPGYKSDLGPESLIVKEPYRDDPSPQGGEGTGLLKNAGKEASDGVQALMQGYGSMDRKLTSNSSKHSSQQQSTLDGALEEDGITNSQKQEDFTAIGGQSNASSDTLGSLRSQNGTSARKKKGDARSGSITENIVEVGGIRKVVLKTNSSSEDDKEEEAKQTKADTSPKSSLYFFGNRSEPQNVAPDEEASPGGEETKKKRRRTRKKKSGKSSDAPAAGGSAAGDQEE